jgi:hypothetical protein
MPKGTPAMTFLTAVINAFEHDPQQTLYYTQGLTYGLACWAVRCGQHAPWQVYLVSCLIHLGLGLLHHWPSG